MIKTVSRVQCPVSRAAALAAVCVLVMGSVGLAQDEDAGEGRSLFKQAMGRRASMEPVSEPVAEESGPRAPVSFTAVAPGQPHRFKKHDLVAVIVQQDSEASTESTAASNKTQTFDTQLQQFLEFSRFAGTAGIGNVANPAKLPEIKFNYDNKTSADASTERKDHMSMRITAEIVDVKPNGTLVLESVAHIRHDKEEQTMRLSGVARSEDVQSDNSILSTNLAKLDLVKETKGMVKDGTKRGWLNGFIDKWSPF